LHKLVKFLLFMFFPSTVSHFMLLFISEYYLKDDSQIEYTNQTLKQYLYTYYNYRQNNWSDLLLLAGFTYNNMSSATTSIFPFFVNKGYYLNINVHSKYNIIFSYTHNFDMDINNLQNTLKAKISAIQQ